MAVLKNQYDEIVARLIPDGFGYYELPEDFKTDCLAIGDVYTVVAEEGDEVDED